MLITHSSAGVLTATMRFLSTIYILGLKVIVSYWNSKHNLSICKNNMRLVNVVYLKHVNKQGVPQFTLQQFESVGKNAQIRYHCPARYTGTTISLPSGKLIGYARDFRSEQCPECRDHNVEQPERLKDMSREEKLLAFIREVTTEIMEVDNDSSEVLSPDNYRPFEFLRKLCRKIGKADSETIYWYYEFGLALTIRINELVENGQKR
ncbi:7826_t:CDS:2, partial [Acaulospora morrowiae]